MDTDKSSLEIFRFHSVSFVAQEKKSGTTCSEITLFLEEVENTVDRGMYSF